MKEFRLKRPATVSTTNTDMGDTLNEKVRIA
jgi:hypothetical protein